MSDDKTMKQMLATLQEELITKPVEEHHYGEKGSVVVRNHAGEPYIPVLPNFVILESPYAGDIERNITYGLACARDCISRGEHPFGSHLYYTQFLDDGVPAQRNMGIEYGFAFWPLAERIVFYVDYGLSNGMRGALERAISERKKIEIRYLGQDH